MVGGVYLLLNMFYLCIYAKWMGTDKHCTRSYSPVTHTSLFKEKQAQMSTCSFGLRGSMKISLKSSICSCRPWLAHGWLTTLQLISVFAFQKIWLSLLSGIKTEENKPLTFLFSPLCSICHRAILVSLSSLILAPSPWNGIGHTSDKPGGAALLGWWWASSTHGWDRQLSWDKFQNSTSTWALT